MPAPTLNPDWPVARSYQGDALRRIAMPVGGLGTGTISLGGRGNLRDFEVYHRPHKGFTPSGWFLALWAQPDGRGDAFVRALEGPVPHEEYEGQSGCRTPNPGLPRFRKASFHAAYPLAQVVLEDPDSPLAVRLEAFNPFAPLDLELGSWPIAVVRVVLENRGRRGVRAALMASASSFCGWDGIEGSPDGASMAFKEGANCQGLWMQSPQVPKTSRQWGSMALATTARRGVTARVPWPAEGLLGLWDDFSDDGALDAPEDAGQASGRAALGAIAVPVPVPPRSERSVAFIAAWHFPNRPSWFPSHEVDGGKEPVRVGNAYAERFADAWDAAEKASDALPKLEQETVRFASAFCASTLPAPLKEAALFNLSTLRTQTVFQTPDGEVHGWEGCYDREGACFGTCTHVWNYQWAMPHLYGSVARAMRAREFLQMTEESGRMAFRMALPAKRATLYPHAAADGQMGTIVRACREWRLSGDEDFARRLWPSIRKALEFCWIPGGWDADRDGVMEGVQHGTMDSDWHGPNPQSGLLYLAALRAGEEFARFAGEAEFAAECRALFERGSAWIDENLFNGDYYEQRVMPSREGEVAKGLAVHPLPAEGGEPPMQLGPGCLIDQHFGQILADGAGLGDLVKRANIRKAVRAILKHNARKDFSGHFTPTRAYALGAEPGIIMASYPRGGRPRMPFPYFAEVMTGFEHTLAIGLLQDGREKEAVEVVSNVRARYDGAKRNPFDEAEAGHHYARALASWGLVAAWTGFDFDGREGRMCFGAKDGLHFWSTGEGWGLCRLMSKRGRWTADLQVHGGRLPLRRLEVRGAAFEDLGRIRRLRRGGSLVLSLTSAAS